MYLELLEQFAFVVEPDFSMYLDFPEPLQKWNHYRNQLLGGLVAGTRAERDPQCQLGRQGKLCLDL